MEMYLDSNFMIMDNDSLINVDGGSKEAAQVALFMGGALMLGFGAPIALGTSVAAGAVWALGAGGCWIAGAGL